MKFRIIALLLVLVMFGSVRSVFAERLSVPEARVQMKDAWNKVRTLSATSLQRNVKVLHAADVSTTLYGTYFLMKKDGKVLIRQDISASSSMDFKGHDVSTSTAIDSTMIGDGTYQYAVSTIKSDSEVKKYKQSPMLCIGGLASMQLFFERYEIRRLADSTYEGQDVFIFEAIAQTKRPRRAVVTIGKKYGILLKRDSYDHVGNLRSSLMYNDIKVNEEIDPKKFVFVPPPGVPILDLSK